MTQVKSNTILFDTGTLGKHPLELVFKKDTGMKI
jgi:hypothetical protein